MKTRNQAIKHAQKIVSPPHPLCQWTYRFLRYDAKAGAWRESTPGPWHEVRHRRAQALVDEAREFLGLPPAQYDGGVWTDYIPRITLPGKEEA